MKQDNFADRMPPSGTVPLSSQPRRHDRLRRNGVHGLVKATFDRSVAALALVLLAPVLLVVALCVVASSPGPVLTRRERVGRDGRPFALLGFRVTDVDRVDAGRSALDQPHGRPELRTEPAETQLGALLRRYSIDELPQLINVLRGDMSLVGPRPASPWELTGFDVDMHRRFPVKPGLTGLGRSDDSRPVDADYAENWSLQLDLLILRQTFAAALRSNGAR